MNNEFKKVSNGTETRYILESATAGSTSASSVANNPSSLGKVQRRNPDNILAQEGDKDKVPANKPRNFVAKNAKMGGAGAHKDKKKAAKQGDVKHKKPFAEQGVAEGSSQTWEVSYDYGPHMTKIVTVKAGSEDEARAKVEKAAEKKGMSIMINSVEPKEQGVAEGSGKNVVKSVKVGNFRHDLVDTGMGWQVRIYNGDELYDTGMSKNSEQKGLAALEDAVAYTEKQTRTKRQGVAEGSLEEYGDTKQGQKMLDKVHHRAANRVTSKQADKDPAYARRAQQTQDRAWERLAVKEGSSDYVGNAIEDLRVSMPGLDRESFLDELYSYLDAQYGKRAADAAFAREDDDTFDEWYDSYRDMMEVSLGDYRKKAGMQKTQAGMGAMFAPTPDQRASSLATFKKREGVAEDNGISKDKETKFHSKLDKLVHNTFGKRKGEMEGHNEPDHEISMASNELESIVADAKRLLDLIKKYSEMEGLEAWQQSKITKAADYVASVLRSIGGEQNALEGLRDPKDNPCWKGYHPVGTKKKNGRTVPNCVPKEDVEESSPKGWEGTVKAMKKNKDIDNPWALANWMKSKGYKSHKEDAYMETLSAMLAEKLDPNADPDVWIQDFQQADPKKYHQFKNKTPEKKAQMAIAARYAAKQPKSKK